MINTKPTFIETILRQIDSKQNSDSPEYLVSWCDFVARRQTFQFTSRDCAYFKAVHIERHRHLKLAPEER
jgi:hypothetical protein